MKRGDRALLVLGAVSAAVLTGCYMVARPPAITNFLSGGRPELRQALMRAAADWARHGLEVANYVTVDDGTAGLPVRYASERELRAGCPNNRQPALAGCTRWEMGDWLEMLIRSDLAENPDALSYIVQHEMIHALVPGVPHLRGADGIFTADWTVSHVTRADMAHLARYADVRDTGIAFVEDG